MTAAPEFSRIVDVGALPPGGDSVEISAGAEERAALADRFGVVAIERLDAVVRLAWSGGTLRAGGRLRARVVQSCVVTLEPVAADVDAAVEVVFARGPQGAGQDAPEPLEGDALDVGEVVASELSLALDPYPRAPRIDLPALGPGLRVEIAAGPPEAPAGAPPGALETPARKR